MTDLPILSDLLDEAAAIHDSDDVKLFASLLHDLEDGDTRHDLLVNRLSSTLLTAAAGPAVGGTLPDVPQRLRAAAAAEPRVLLSVSLDVLALSRELRLLGMLDMASALRELLLAVLVTRLGEEVPA